MRFTQQEIHAVFDLVGLHLGRHFGSKSQYRESHPGCRYVPNSSIFVREGRIWGGDLDLAKDGCSLCQVSRLLGRKLFVTFEQVKYPVQHRWVVRDTVATIWQGKISYFCRTKPVIPPTDGWAWW